MIHYATAVLRRKPFGGMRLKNVVSFLKAISGPLMPLEVPFRSGEFRQIVPVDSLRRTGFPMRKREVNVVGEAAKSATILNDG